MMNSPLLLTQLIERARTLWSRREVVTQGDKVLVRSSYGEVIQRATRLASALSRAGILKGDRVATMLWNTQAHLELYFAVPILGSVLHTVNFRLSNAQIKRLVDHADDKILFIDEEFAPLIRELLPSLKSVERVIVIGASRSNVFDGTRFEHYSSFLAGGDEASFEPPDLDENDPCGLCYTSGTTGEPKGVVYSHRSNVLHALVSSMADSCAVRARTVLLPVVPMFHVNAWGLPYTSALTGAKLVLPGKHLAPRSLLTLMNEERVTLGAGIPTIWNGLLAELDAGFPRPGDLETLLVGGAAASPSMIRGFWERHKIHVLHAWGMTETSPLGTVCHVKPDLPQSGDEHFAIRAKQGLPGALLEVRIVDDLGKILPWDGEAVGGLEIRGPWVTEGYAKDSSDVDGVMTEDGWFRTGDVATIDGEGYVEIVDRTKDLIRSGGEWISSVKIESCLVGHESVREAVVVPVPDEKWGERPMAFLTLKTGCNVGKQELDEFLLNEFPRWQIPDRYSVVEEIPKTAIGKLDKKRIRARIREEGAPGRPLG